MFMVDVLSGTLLETASNHGGYLRTTVEAELGCLHGATGMREVDEKGGEGERWRRRGGVSGGCVWDRLNRITHWWDLG